MTGILTEDVWTCTSSVAASYIPRGRFDSVRIAETRRGANVKVDGGTGVCVVMQKSVKVEVEYIFIIQRGKVEVELCILRESQHLSR